MLRDCYELWKAGFRDSVNYRMDTTGSGNIAAAIRIQCWEGWSRVLRRGEYKNKVSSCCRIEHCKNSTRW